MSLRLVQSADVVDARSYAEYAHQTLGVPGPGSQKDLIMLKHKLNEFWVQYPKADWATLARTVDWARAKKRRTATAWGLLYSVRFAWADGALPELDPQTPVDRSVEDQIDAALAVETDERWRRMLIGSCGCDNRRRVLRSWQNRTPCNG